MKTVLLTVGRTSTPYIREAMGEYVKRINRYAPMEVAELPDLKNGSGLNEAQRREREGEMILGALQPSDIVILLDERGRQLTSEEFSRVLEGNMSHGVKRLVFIVGGPYGFSEAVYRRGNAKLSLSRMTFTHEMVRLFFTEQIYRAHTILHGEPYHHV